MSEHQKAQGGWESIRDEMKQIIEMNTSLDLLFPLRLSRTFDNLTSVYF